MDYNRIELLLHKYLEGNTTIREEKELNVFFNANDEIPEQFLYAKDIFGFFSEEKSIKYAKRFETRKPKSRTKLYYLTGIAASLLFAILLLFSNDNAENKIIYAYIDGRAITDISIAEEYTKQILLSASNKLDKGTRSLYYTSQFTNPIKLIKK